MKFVNYLIFFIYLYIQFYFVASFLIKNQHSFNLHLKFLIKVITLLNFDSVRFKSALFFVVLIVSRVRKVY